ncbi:MAG: signal recognition particle-docking protein FtsY [Candidatus Thorarchaeota archaeon]|jgi:fused signal recognition particle receptor
MFDRLRGALDSAVTKATTRELTEKNLADAVWDLQLVLIQNDVAVEVAEHICKLTEEKILGTRLGRLEKTSKLFRSALYESIIEVLTPEHPIDLIEYVSKRRADGLPTAILFVGVNGTGKTTTLAKLAHIYTKKGFSVVLAAGDTFRAGSIEQLERHAERIGVRVIKQSYGADAAAIAYDAVQHARARHIDVVLIDSAGRMQTNKNLLEEMKKIVRVAEPDLKIFVGDALAGNDALSQAQKFDEAIGLDGAILTKVDADPSGGAALSVALVTGKPVVYVGVGQNYEDLQKFDPEWFARKIVSDN